MSEIEHTRLSSRPRVAYLLADAGIVLSDSKKGCSIHARSMIKALTQEGCAVDVHTFRAGRERDSKHVKIHEVRQSRFTRWWRRRMMDAESWRKRRPDAAGDPIPNWITAVGWWLWHRDFWKDVRRRTARRPPQFIYARSAYLAWPYARLRRTLGVPMFLEVNSCLVLEKEARGELAFARLSRRIETEMFRCADHILPVSAEIKDQIIGYGIDGAKIEVTPNAVDLELFAPAAPPPDHAARFTIGTVNSMRGYHGMSTLLRAAALLKDEIPPLKLLLIGAGPLFEEIKAEAVQLGIVDRVEFTGTLDHARVPERLRECDVCVSPNEGEANQYNCPMKLFEYMALGIPIVASRWGDIPNIIRDGETGLLHEPGDPHALAAALRSVWIDRSGARRRADAARSVAEKRTWRAIARRIMRQSGVGDLDEFTKRDQTPLSSNPDPIPLAGGVR